MNFHDGNGAGNYEYVVVRDYTADFTYGSLVAASETPTKMTSYRLLDDAIAWEFNAPCGSDLADLSSPMIGINCVGPAPNNHYSSRVCNFNGNSQENWYRIQMRNSDMTRLSVCNGVQETGFNVDMNHRFWFREAMGDTFAA